MEFTNQVILVAGLLFIVSILASVLTPRLGMPLLLVFLVVGMLAGEDGPGGIRFGNYALANLVATVALAVILFDGGLRTRMETFRVGLWPALSLATGGVLVTTAIVGVFSAWLLHLQWAEGLLIGAIVGSTDAAAVFSVLHTRALSLNQRVTSALEIESGTNDPLAVLLTLGLLQYLAAPADYHAGDSALLLARQMGIGAALGLGGGTLLAQGINRLELGDALYPLLALFGGLLVFGLTAVLGGSGFLAVYLAGLVVGNRRVHGHAAIRRFHDGVAWLAQIAMFLILGLLVTPSRLLPVAAPGLLIALVLILLARPAAVALCLLPFRFPWREQVYIAWVGLRGSVPVLLATYPWLAGAANAELYFNIAFFIVLVSLVIQGWTVAPAARLLGLVMPQTSARVQRVDLDLPGQRGYEIVSYRLASSSTLLGMQPKKLPIPDASRVICVARAGRLLPYREWGGLQAGDYVSLLASQEELPALDRVFQAVRRPTHRTAQRFFGEFSIDPQASLASLCQHYGLPPPAGTDRSVGELLARALPNPVAGDRLRLGEMQLIVRRMEDGRVAEVGLLLPH